MSSPLEKIKETLSIVDVVGSYVQLEKAGTNFKAKCPFHNEKSPSFFVSPERNTYYCFGCGAKGDIISFVQEFEGLDFIGALKVLAQRAGVELGTYSGKERSEKDRLFQAMEMATLYFQQELGKRPDALEYLKKRGLTDVTISSWRIGYAPVEWRAVSTHLKAKGFNAAEIEKIGLAKKSEKNPADSYDRFRGRIMFPIFDSSGRTIAFSGRQFESDGTEAKYINSPETPLFQKSHVLYGFDRAKLEIRRRDYALLVEGQMDLIMAHQAGFSNAVASSGTALTTEQLTIMKRLSAKLMIAYDGDEAGGAAAARGWNLALAQGFDIKVVTLPDGQDPADVIRENPKVFADAVAHAEHIIDVQLTKILQHEKDERKRGQRIEKEVLPYVADLGSAIERSYFVSRIAGRSGIKEEFLWAEVRKRERPETAYETTTERPAEKNRRQSIERLLFGLVFWQEGHNNSLSLDTKAKISSIIGEDKYQAIETKLSPIKDQLIFEAEISFNKSEKLAEHIEELVLHFKEEYLRDEFTRAMQALQEAERQKNTPEVTRLLEVCQSLSNRLREVKTTKT